MNWKPWLSREYLSSSPVTSVIATGELILGVKFGGFGLFDFHQRLGEFHRGEHFLPSDDRWF